MKDGFITVDLTKGRRPVTLNTGTIASVRPQTTSHGSLIVCIGGACYATSESFDAIRGQLA